MNILRLGDSALTCVFSARERESKYGNRVKRGLERYRGDGILDVWLGVGCVSVYVDGERVGLSCVEDWIEEILEGEGEEEECEEGRMWLFPVCYEGGEDRVLCAEYAKMSEEEVVKVHREKRYEVLMIGFLPGFPFMGYVDERLGLGRRKSPRERVEAGSVAVAGGMTCIYPWESPGGWHILGMCPVPLFRVSRGEDACLLGVGDGVKFYEVERREYEFMREEMGREDFDVRVLREEEGE